MHKMNYQPSLPRVKKNVYKYIDIHIIGLYLVTVIIICIVSAILCDMALMTGRKEVL